MALKPAGGPLPNLPTLTEQELRQRAPELTVRIREIDTDEVTRGLNDGSPDVALARLATSRAGVRTQVIVREEFVVIAPPAHPIAHVAGRVDLADLAEEHWAGIAREVSPDYHDEMAAVFRANGIAPSLHHMARPIGSQIAIVATGAGLSIVPRSAVRGEAEDIVARPVTTGARTVTLATSTSQRPERYERLFRLGLEEVVAAPDGHPAGPPAG